MILLLGLPGLTCDFDLRKMKLKRHFFYLLTSAPGPRSSFIDGDQLRFHISHVWSQPSHLILIKLNSNSCIGEAYTVSLLLTFYDLLRLNELALLNPPYSLSFSLFPYFCLEGSFKRHVTCSRNRFNWLKNEKLSVNMFLAIYNAMGWD